MLGIESCQALQHARLFGQTVESESAHEAEPFQEIAAVKIYPRFKSFQIDSESRQPEHFSKAWLIFFGLI